MGPPSTPPSPGRSRVRRRSNHGIFFSLSLVLSLSLREQALSPAEQEKAKETLDRREGRKDKAKTNLGLPRLRQHPSWYPNPTLRPHRYRPSSALAGSSHTAPRPPPPPPPADRPRLLAAPASERPGCHGSAPPAAPAATPQADPRGGSPRRASLRAPAR
eukprot:scaffold347_cov239-Pinguiococcus_pyrenoidosus.AAC.25